MLKLFVSLQNRVAELRDHEDGQTMAEYGIILAVIAVVVAVSALALGGRIDAAYDKILP